MADLASLNKGKRPLDHEIVVRYYIEQDYLTQQFIIGRKIFKLLGDAIDYARELDGLGSSSEKALALMQAAARRSNAL